MLVAQELLGLEYAQSDRLFFVDYWPGKFAYNKAKTKKAKAEIAAKRIEHFIKTGGAE